MISYRLKSLVKFIENKDKVADIGCDHALLDVYLIENKVVDKIIVGDIHEDALNQGIDNIKKHKLTKSIDARLGDGLSILNKKDKIDTIIISGMGTSTIINILNNGDLSNINKLVIQSNNDHELLRKRLINMEYYIEAEEYFVDKNKNYINIVFKKGNRSYSKLEIMYGPFLIKSKKYLQFEKNKLNKIKSYIPNMTFKQKIIFNHNRRVLNRLIIRSDKDA